MWSNLRSAAGQGTRGRRLRAVLRGLALASAALTISLTTGPPAAAGAQPAYLDPHRSVEDRVGNLPNPVCEQKILIDNHAGSILAGGTDIPPDTTGSGGPGNTGRDWANEYNTMQRFAIDNSRLHIPVVFGVDAVHGFGHPFQAPLFPQSIGMGATWDPSAARAGGAVTGRALMATGWNWDFAPVQDLSRDNRWGRTYETWAEEPALAAAMGGAFVRGLQSI